jgi:hypothetical protein
VRCCERCNQSTTCIERTEISSLRERLVASQNGLCSIKLARSVLLSILRSGADKSPAFPI